MRIAMLGTRGVPAQYGGFETCVEEVGRRLVAAGHRVVVYCRTPAGELAPEQTEHAGMQLVHLPAVRKKSLETLSHTALSAAHLLRNPADVAIVFNSANAVFLPALRARGIPIVTHVDGLEWKRSKWRGAGRRYYRAAESMAVRWSDALIADAQGIADYYTGEFRAETELIAYGAPILAATDPGRLAALELTPQGYHLVVARFEPENNVGMIIEGYRRSSATLPLVVVGAAPYADKYTAQVHAAADSRVRFLGSVWDQDLLDELYANCATYLHGHSVGGTNPSLLRAMGAGAPTIAFDVVFNREVLGSSGCFFAGPGDVRDAVEQAEGEPARTADRGRAARVAAARYDWDDVAMAYEQLCVRMTAAGSRRRRNRIASGRRHRDRRDPAAAGTGGGTDRLMYAPHQPADIDGPGHIQRAVT